MKSNRGCSTSKEILLSLLRAITQKISKNISKLINKGISDSGLSIPIKGKTQLINNPPNIKKATLKPIIYTKYSKKSISLILIINIINKPGIVIKKIKEKIALR